MIIKKYTEYRITKDAEFWHNLPEIKEWLDPFEQKCITDGLVISIDNEISEDGMIFQRTVKFPNEDSYIQMMTLAPDQEYQQTRQLYNVDKNHIWYSDNEIV